MPGSGEGIASCAFILLPLRHSWPVSMHFSSSSVFPCYICGVHHSSSSVFLSYISGVHHSSSAFPNYISGVHHSSFSAFPCWISGVHHSSSSSAFPSYISGVHHSSFYAFPSYISGLYHSTFSSAVPSYISGVHHLGWDFCVCGLVFCFVFFNPTIEVVTFRLCGWCMLDVFLLPAFTCLGHERQDLLSPCKGMHVCTDQTSVYTLIWKNFLGNGGRTHVNSAETSPLPDRILPRGESNPWRCIKQDSMPNTLPTCCSSAEHALLINTRKIMSTCFCDGVTALKGWTSDAGH